MIQRPEADDLRDKLILAVGGREWAPEDPPAALSVMADVLELAADVLDTTISDGRAELVDVAIDEIGGVLEVPDADGVRSVPGQLRLAVTRLRGGVDRYERFGGWIVVNLRAELDERDAIEALRGQRARPGWMAGGATD